MTTLTRSEIETRFANELGEARSLLDEEIFGRVVPSRVKRGVNLSGGSDIDDVWWSFPTTAEIQWAKRQGFEVIRVPYRWERLQPTVGAAFNATHSAALDNVVRAIVSNGMIAMPVAHNFGGRGASGSSSVLGTQYKIGSATITHAHWEDFCLRLGGLWTDIASNVWLDLMNEPESLPLNGYATTTDHLVAIYNKGIAKVRQAGFTGRIVIEGNGYNNAQFFDTNPWYNASSTPPTSADAFHAGIVDSANNWIASVHNYPENSHGDELSPIANARTLRTRMSNVLSWCAATGRSVIVGEFAANPADQYGEAVVRDFLQLAIENAGTIEALVWWESRSSDETTSAYNLQTDTAPVDKRIAWMRDLDAQVVADPVAVIKTLDGTAAGTSTVSATTIARVRNVAGSAAGATTASATTIVRRRTFSGTAAGTSTTSGALGVRRAMTTTTIAGSGSVSATTITRRRALGGAVAGSATTSASTLRRACAMTASASGTATSSATTITRRRSLAATAAGIAAVAASVALVRPLTASANGTSTTSATTIARRRPLASSVAGTTTTSGALSLRRPFAGGAVGTSDVLASLAGQGMKTFAGSAVGTSAVSASLARFRGLTGSVAGAGAGNASSLILARRLTGSVAGTGAASATTLRRARALTASASGTGGASATLAARRTLLASASGAATSSATTIVRRRALGGSCTGTSTTTASLLIPQGFYGTATGTSNVTASMRVARPLSATTSGTSTCSATGIRRRCAMTGDVFGTSIGAGSLIAARSMLGTTAGVATTSAQLAVVGTGVQGAVIHLVEESVRLEAHACESVLFVYSVRTGDPRMGLKVGATVTLHIGCRYKGRRYDASSLTVHVRAPSGSIQTFTLAQATRVRQGDYTVTFTADEATTRTSTWKYVTQCTIVTPAGTIRGSDDGQFDVDALPFTLPP